MKLDRKLQYDILNQLAEQFPQITDEIYDLNCCTEENEEEVIANAIYLQKHGLIDYTEHRGIDATIPSIYSLEITHKGLDFLMDDGGIGAILNVVTVKLHDDSLKALLIYQINNSKNLPDEQKKSLTEHIKRLPEELAKKFLDKISEKGIEALFAYGSELYPLIQRLLNEIAP